MNNKYGAGGAKYLISCLCAECVGLNPLCLIFITSCCPLASDGTVCFLVLRIIAFGTTIARRKRNFRKLVTCAKVLRSCTCASSQPLGSRKISLAVVIASPVWSTFNGSESCASANVTSNDPRDPEWEKGNPNWPVQGARTSIFCIDLRRCGHQVCRRRQNPGRNRLSKKS